MKTLYIYLKKSSDSRLTQTKTQVLLPPTLTSATTHRARSGLRAFALLCLERSPPGAMLPLTSFGSVYISQSGVPPRVTAPQRAQPSMPAPLSPGLAFFFLPMPVFSWPITYFRYPPASTRTRPHEGGQGSVSLGHSLPPEPRTVPDPQDILSNVCHCTTGNPQRGASDKANRQSMAVE